MSTLFFLTHPEVVIDPKVPVPEWHLSPIGRARMESFCARKEVSNVRHVYTSSERKALDGGEIISHRLGVPLDVDSRLGEIDRSSTGYLPKALHDSLGELAMENPMHSVRGWERAVDAQRRVANAVRDIRTRHPFEDVVVVSHGGVGLLFLCSVLGVEISRAYTAPNRNGGCYFCIDSSSGALRTSWKDIEQT